MELECEICYCPFDDEETRPRVLPCAHSYCENCIDNNIKKERKSCPACRKSFTIDSAKDLPANYALEKILQKLLLADDRPEEEQIDDFNSGICPKHRHNRLYFVCKSENNNFSRVCHVSGPICRDCKVLDHEHCTVKSIEDDIKDLRKSRTKDANEIIATSETRISGLRKFNDKISEKIKEKENMVKELLEEIEELNLITDRAERAESVIAGNMYALKDSQSLLEMSSTKKEMTETCQDVLNKINEAEPHLDAIDDKYDLDIEFGPELLALDPINFIPRMKMETPAMWAFAEIDNNLYGAEVFITNDFEHAGKVHMEALKKDHLPPEGYDSVPADKLLSLLPQEHPIVYMDLSLDGEVLGTVYITVLPSIENSYGKQFLALFTGSLGASYRDRNFEDRTNCILSVYHYNFGNGCASSAQFVSDFCYGFTNYPKEKGSVFNAERGGFKIFHKDESGFYNTKYGTVTGGMEVIERIAANESWKDVVICELGVVLG